jgi:hypothetical protein
MFFMSAPISSPMLQSAPARHNPTHPTPPSNLSPVQHQVVATLAQGCTAPPFKKWLNTAPAFRAALTDARSQYAAQLCDAMKELSAAALETLGTLLHDAQNCGVL